jgi:galactonate dehydratase
MAAHPTEKTSHVASIASITPFVVNLSPKSNWFFVRVTNDAGVHGYGEGTLYGRETEQLAALESLKPIILGRPAQLVHMAMPAGGGGLVASSVVSALEQAITDLRAREWGTPLYKELGVPPQRTAIRMYANINRRTEDRSPDGFAASARDALAQGFLAVKIAPFDGVVPQALGTKESRALIDAGIARIHATRDAIGENTVLMVDCHWRFDEKTAATVLKELKSAKLFWFECPIAETEENHPALKKLRRVAHRIETRLAGAEQGIGVDGFKPFVEGGLYDVVMPDVKYAGGYQQMLRIAEMCQRSQVDFSPHNPTGPVCTMASLHICAVAPNFLLLEHQLGESPLYHELVRGAHPEVRDGCFDVPSAPGLGIDLDEDLMRAHPYQPLTNVRDARLGQGGR